MKFNPTRMAKTLFALVVSMLALTGCSNSVELSDHKLNVVTTVYPIFDFASQIGGEYANVINLVPTGVDAHDWSPKSRDMSYLSKSQLFLYNGAGFEGWVDDFLSGIDSNSQLKSVVISNGIDLIIPNDEHSNEGHEHKSASDHEVDPHTWLSPKSAIIMAENIKNAFVQADPDHQSTYEQNYEQLREKLQQLDDDYEQAFSSNSLANRKFVVSHQSFGYLARDYDLEQIAILGLAPDTEPTAGDLRQISNTIREHGITTIFFEELVSDRLVKTLAHDLGVQTEILHSLEGLTEQQEQSGDNYISLMKKNLQSLLKSLQ